MVWFHLRIFGFDPNTWSITLPVPNHVASCQFIHVFPAQWILDPNGWASQLHRAGCGIRRPAPPGRFGPGNWVDISWFHDISIWSMWSIYLYYIYMINMSIRIISDNRWHFWRIHLRYFNVLKVCWETSWIFTDIWIWRIRKEHNSPQSKDQYES